MIVDEFYKASADYDKERAGSLVKAILELGKKSKQKYYLAPNIDSLEGNSLTEGMEFLKLDFNTVFLDVVDLSGQVGKDEHKKSDSLLEILSENPGKCLIYAGTYSGIEAVSNLLLSSLPTSKSKLLVDFSEWLVKNYSANWSLTRLASRGVGIHNGRLHRSLTQIQIKLFEEQIGLRQIISTSSIIEGVNTSAENVVLWSNKNGNVGINDFTYKNIIGRGGRMLKYFIGNVFVLENPPSESRNQLELAFPDELIGLLDAGLLSDETLSSDQVAAIEAFKHEIGQSVGTNDLDGFIASSQFQSNDTNQILKIASELKTGQGWSGLGYLNSRNPNDWERMLYRLLRLRPQMAGAPYSTFVALTKSLSENWALGIPQILAQTQADVTIEKMFEIEKNISFKLASLVGDINILYNRMNPNNVLDLSPAITRFSNAFLPSNVYKLEEYGLPRMISRKIHQSQLVDLEDSEIEFSSLLDEFREIGFSKLTNFVEDLDSFDIYILEYFFEGITVSASGSEIHN